MKKLSGSYIISLCSKLERLTKMSIERRAFNKTISLLKGLSNIRYNFFLGYKNDFIEEQIVSLAQHIHKKDFMDNNNDKSIVIVDEINADYIGLMVQYLSALITDSYQILYIYEHKEHSTAVRTQLMQMLQSYGKAQIKEIPSTITYFEKSQWIYDEICTFGSKKVMMHFGEWAVEKCVAISALPKECVRYRINCADHCFWAGASCVDYTFEFRHYGANLSYHERGLEQNHIIYLPFYPVMQETPFAGFPEECDNKIVFFSGGAVYKIVDEGDTFFRLCKTILDTCPDSVVLFAGADNDNHLLADAIERYGLRGRFIPIGYRKDILEVFKHSDVYINTYPVGGGLMCQYAAQCSKPILNFKGNGIEECVAQKKECSFTAFTEDAFLNEAVRLYSDIDYRKKRGISIHQAVISKEEFDKALLCFLSMQESSFEIKWDEYFVPKNYSMEDAIIFNNNKLYGFYYKLYRLMGYSFISTMPWNFITMGIYGIKRKIKKMCKM